MSFINIFGTVYCRYLEEITSCTAVAPSLIQNEYFGIQLMMKYGSDEQKAKYLPGMLSGKFLSATCISESSEDFMSQTAANFNTDQNQWVRYYLVRHLLSLAFCQPGRRVLGLCK